MNTKLFRNALTLGLITASGGLGIDMYLPAFPAIAHDLNTNVGAVQMSLVVYLLALALGQVFYGPLSDVMGRRAPLLMGMSLYTGASVACIFAANVEQLIIFRALQGLGGCAGMVIVRAIVRDMYTGPEAVRLLSLILAVVGVSPILSPVLGGVLTQALSWSAIFWCLAGAGLLSMVLCTFVLRETRPQHERVEAGVAATLRVYRRLLRDSKFVGLSLIPGLNQGGTFAFVSGSAFLFIELLGADPATYSLIFAGCSVGMIGGAQFAAMAVRAIGPERTILAAMSVNVVGGLLLLAATAGGFLSLPLVFGAFFMVFSSLGFIGAPASVLALEPHGAVSGTASALMGSLQMAWGAAGGALVSALFNGTAWPIALTLSGFGLSALTVASLTFGLGKPRRDAPA